jgi:hypothetical protein
MNSVGSKEHTSAKNGLVAVAFDHVLQMPKISSRKSEVIVNIYTTFTAENGRIQHRTSAGRAPGFVSDCGVGNTICDYHLSG